MNFPSRAEFHRGVYIITTGRWGEGLEYGMYTISLTGSRTRSQPLPPRPDLHHRTASKFINTFFFFSYQVCDNLLSGKLLLNNFNRQYTLRLIENIMSL